MNLKILTVNCNKGYVPGLEDFLKRTLAEEKYDFIFLQEVRARKQPRLDPLMTDILGNYSLLRAFNDKVNTWSEIVMLYRKDFRLIESKFFPFPPYVRYPHVTLSEFGFLKGTFATPEGRVIAGSVHLHSDWRFLARKREAKLIKQVLRADYDRGVPIIFGGDFNTGLPGEKLSHYRIFGPEFANCTAYSGPTVDSNYLEPSNLQAACVVRLLKFFRIRLHMKVDHIYVDRKTRETHASECRVLSDRVSDHSPVEVVLKQF